MTFNTPILFITYKRIDTAQRVFKAIQSVQPARLYFASNAPNPDRPNEFTDIALVRSLLNNINWKCEIHCRFPPKHLNVQQSIIGAINWFFNQETEGIILEDDCVPESDFFFYCQQLLLLYRDNTRVWTISGNKFNGLPSLESDSYYFSSYFHCWGWASWRRAWINNDLEMKQYPIVLKSGLLKTLLPFTAERIYWRIIWDKIYYKNIPLTWDYQWFFSGFVKGALHISPCCNLVANIGFRDDAENTTTGSSRLAPVGSILPLKHPQIVRRDLLMDNFESRYYFSPNNYFDWFKLIVKFITHFVIYLRYHRK